MNKCLLHSTKALNFLRTHLLSLLLLFFYLTEGYSKLTVLTFGERPLLTKTLKLVVLLFVILKLLHTHKLIKQIFLITICFILGQLFISPNFQENILISLVKYLFPIILFAYFNKYRINLKTIRKTENIFVAIILINSVLIFLGVIFQIDLFETYKGDRFGYNGLFVSSATGSYVYIIALFYFLFKYKKQIIYNGKAIFIAIMCLLIGTKSIYLILGLTFLFYFIFYTNNRKRQIGVALIILLSIVGAYYMLFLWDTFNDIRKTEGVLTSILSFRDKLFLEKMIPFLKNNWSVVNYLFGGINTISTRSQMGFIDLFYFFGAIGSILYFYTYVKNYIKFRITKEFLFFLLSLGIIIFISGNFFLNASIVVYILFIREFMRNDVEC